MENVPVLTKILDFIFKPMNFIIVIAIFLTSITVYLLNFLPEKILEIMKIEGFLEDFSFYIFLIVVITFFLLLVQGIYLAGKKIKEYVGNRRYKKHQKEVFQDEYCFKILEDMYEQHPQSMMFPEDNQCIKLLRQYNLIVRPHNTGIMTRMGSQRYHYVLQPETVKMIKQRNI